MPNIMNASAFLNTINPMSTTPERRFATVTGYDTTIGGVTVQYPGETTPGTYVYGSVAGRMPAVGETVVIERWGKDLVVTHILKKYTDRAGTSADQFLNNQAAVQPIVGLDQKVYLEANTQYAVRGFYILTATAVADVKLRTDLPTSAIARWLVEGYASGLATTVLYPNENTSWVIPANGGNALRVRFEGTIITGSTAGFITCAYSQNVAEVSNIYIYRGSNIQAIRL